MENKEIDISLFDRYLRHELSESELKSFNESLINDDAFNETFITYKTLALGIRDFGKADLKKYLKANAKTPHSDNMFPFGKTVYAMAASLVLIAGFYYLFNHYATSKKETPIAVTESLKQATAEDTSISETKTPEEEGPVVAEAPKQTPAVTETKDLKKVIESDDIMEKGTVAAAPESMDEVEYEIIADHKLSDTLLYVFEIIGVDEDLALNKQTETKQKDKYVRKSLPSQANNNNYAKNENTFKIDTVTSSGKKSKDVPATPYMVEYWQSPVNFTGYKMGGKTIQLFGINSKDNRLYQYNQKIYLRTSSNVYILSPCAEGCTFKPELNQDILNQILNNK